MTDLADTPTRLPRDADERARCTYSTAASALHDPAALAEVLDPVVAVLAALGARRAAPEEMADRPHVIVVATGGTEHQILDLVDRRADVAAAEPTLLVAHGAQNSLPAALEALAAIRQRGGRGRIVMVDSRPTSSEGDTGRPGAERLDAAITDIEALHRLRSTRLALVGGPSDWLVASSPSSEVVARRWGPVVAVVESEALAAALAAADPTAVAEVAARFSTAPGADTGAIPADEVDAAARVGVALHRTVGAAGCGAVSVRCFDLLGTVHTSGCLALARLNELGITAGCEGDLPSTLAMLWARHLLGRPAWMANPARIDEATNEVVLAHCTIDPSMTSGLTLDTHFESGIGVGIRGHLPPQPVTLVRLGGADLERCWIADADIVGEHEDTHLCRTQVSVRLLDRCVDELLRDPLGNHLVVVPGHHRRRLEDWWELVVA